MTMTAYIGLSIACIGIVVVYQMIKVIDELRHIARGIDELVYIERMREGQNR